MKNNDFNAIAFIYDFLAGIIFGRSILKAQACHIDRIPAAATVLIIGGGTGKILQELDKLNRQLDVTFVEPSAAMMRRAKNRQPFQNINIEFLHAGYETLSTHPFDAIITHFFLDLFDEQHLPHVMQFLSARLKTGGIWIFADFAKTKSLWQKSVMWVMYRFFNLTAGVQGQKLVDFEKYFELMDFKNLEEKRFYQGMIRSSVYRRY